MRQDPTYTAFAGNRLIASGDVRSVIRTVKEWFDCGQAEPLLVFEDQTGTQIDFDLRGTSEDALAQLAVHPHFAGSDPSPTARAGPGRPRLGVVCREVSLLPRHWAWLGQAPGGASGALRRIVDEAMTCGRPAERARRARAAAGSFMWAIAGNLPHFEEASRALYARDQGRLDELIAEWPEDIRKHLGSLVSEAVHLEKEASPGHGARG